MTRELVRHALMPFMADKAQRDLITFYSLLALAAVVRLYWVDQPLIDLFSWRQASTAMIAQNIPLNNWNIFYPEANWTGPGPSYQGREFQIYTLLVAALQEMTEWTDAAGRLVSTCFGLLTVFSLHRLTALVWDEAHAHWAALVYALLPAGGMIDSSFLPDATMLGLLTTGVWLYVRYFLGEKHVILVLAATAFGLGALAKLPGLGAGLVVAYLVMVLLLRQQTRRAIYTMIAMVFILAVIISYYAWAIHLGTSYPPYHVAGSGYIWDDGVSSFAAHKFYLGRASYISSHWFYGWLILGLFAIGLLMPPSSRKDPEKRALAWVPLIWLVGAGTIYLAGAREISHNPWNLHIFSVPIAMFAGSAILLLLRILSKKSVSLGRLWAVVAVVALGASATFPLMQRMKAPWALQAQQLGLDLARRRANDDLVIAISPAIGDPIAIYYANARGWVFPPGGGDTDWSLHFKDDATAIAEIEALRAQGAQWFGYAKSARDVRKRLFTNHHAGLIEWLDDRFEKVADTVDYAIYRL